MFQIKTTQLLTLAGATGLALIAGPATAAVISVAGSDTDNADVWRTTTAVKALDPDGDNVYGTEGYLLFYTRDAGTSFSFQQRSGDPMTAPGNLVSLPSYLGITSNGADWTGISQSFPDYDDPTQTPSASVSDVKTALAGNNGSASSNLFDLTFSSGAPAAGIRVGVFARHTGQDGVEDLALTQTTGGSAAASIATLATGADNPALYFFDITGIQAGDVFTLSADDLTVPNAGTFITGFSFDVIPEPASLALMGLGGLLMLGRGRRAQR